MILVANAAVHMSISEFNYNPKNGYVVFIAPAADPITKPSNILAIYDHRPETVAFAKELISLGGRVTKTGSCRYKMSVTQAIPICCNARVQIDEKTIGKDHIPVVNLYPLDPRFTPMALFAVMSHKNDGFAVVEDRALWSWYGISYSRSFKSATKVTVSLTNNYAILRVAYKPKGYEREAVDTFTHLMPE